MKPPKQTLEFLLKRVDFLEKELERDETSDASNEIEAIISELNNLIDWIDE